MATSVPRIIQGRARPTLLGIEARRAPDAAEHSVHLLLELGKIHRQQPEPPRLALLHHRQPFGLRRRHAEEKVQQAGLRGIDVHLVGPRIDTGHQRHELQHAAGQIGL